MKVRTRRSPGSAVVALVAVLAAVMVGGSFRASSPSGQTPRQGDLVRFVAIHDYDTSAYNGAVTENLRITGITPSTSWPTCSSIHRDSSVAPSRTADVRCTFHEVGHQFGHDTRSFMNITMPQLSNGHWIISTDGQP